MNSPQAQGSFGRTMDLRYLLGCLADPEFFESVDRLGDHDSRYAASDRAVREGWERQEEGGWVRIRPVKHGLPEQGWKIHVSTTPDGAETVLETVWAYCLAHELSFKFLRSARMLLVANFKYADRASSGKFITVYPRQEAELRRTLEELDAALERHEGPYVLSDLRWARGPLHVRYGAFREQYCSDDDGHPVPAIRDGSGHLVPDVRRPTFTVPSGTQLPGFLEPHLGRRAAEATDFPYTVTQPLHFSNGGGVYLAERRGSAERIVLKEARPFAGLDERGTDATVRLRQEFEVMETLAALPFVPRVHAYEVHWEHHFLIREHVEGQSLNRVMSGRYPLTRPCPSLDEIRAYTRWALDVLDQAAEALAELHRRGIVFGDLHPRNLIVRPDGGVSFIDFELAGPLREHEGPGLGAAGFTSQAARTGEDVDRHALACLRMAVFLPLTPLLAHDPGKLPALLDAVVERFSLPAAYAARTLEDACLAMQFSTRGPADAPSPPVGTDLSESTTLAAVAAAVVESATPERADRLYPGDVEQLRFGGGCLAFGAAGVLYALARAGASIPSDHVEWLARYGLRSTQRTAVPGLYTGLHGIAYVLDALGHADAADGVLDRCIRGDDDERAQVDLLSGLAGVGLTWRHFANVLGDGNLSGRADQAAERLAARLRGSQEAGSQAGVGLMRGWSGPALFFLRLHADTADGAYLDLAEEALRRDLQHCVQGPHGELQVDDRGQRLLPYLAGGSAGIAIVLDELLRQRPVEDLADAAQRLRHACHAEFVINSGLFNGRAGMLAALHWLSGPGLSERDRSGVLLHLDRLSWHLIPRRGLLCFPGEHLLRLSMDLATGSAGVLLAVTAAVDDSHELLPFLAPERGRASRDRTHASTREEVKRHDGDPGASDTQGRRRQRRGGVHQHA